MGSRANTEPLRLPTLAWLPLPVAWQRDVSLARRVTACPKSLTRLDFDPGELVVSHTRNSSKFTQYDGLDEMHLLPNTVYLFWSSMLNFGVAGFGVF